MRETIKNILGFLIVLTLIYVIFISYNIYQFYQTDQVNMSEEDYRKQIELFQNDLAEIENKFNEQNFYESSKSINLNFDGTPVTWVIAVKLDTDKTNLADISEALFDEGYLTFIFKENLYIGPYIDKSQLEFAKEFLSLAFEVEGLEIIEWKI